jgi:cell fate (sporulation/competence/biofilm development) regulator YlbF (YheA/YmcA/DUF963 family)
MSDIMIQAYKVLEELKNEESYKLMKKLNQEMIFKYQKEIDAFQKDKNEFNQMMNEGGAYHPDFKMISQRFQQSKKELYEKDLIIQYFKAEKTFEDILNEFMSELTQNISSYIEPKGQVVFKTKGGSCHVR